MSVHVPVLGAEVLQWLQPRAGGVYVDATVGYGGHAAAILAAAPGGRLIGLDRDERALAGARERLAAFGARAHLVHADFAQLGEVLAGQPADGILFDVGVSSAQLDDPVRGFSFRADAPLDMRMDPSRGQTAADLVNTLPGPELAEILLRYGEERWAARIADFVVQARRRRPIATTGDLVEIIRAAVRAGARRGPGHPARRTFQALRIAVNGELDALRAGLAAAAAALAPLGRVVVIAFHSLEDRIVKTTFRGLGQHGFAVLTKKPVRPTAAETAANPRARSARLRALAREGIGA